MCFCLIYINLKVTVENNDKFITRRCKINFKTNKKTAITTLKAFDNYLACGNLSGYITIIETNNFSILFTITAHVRFITGLEYI